MDDTIKLIVNPLEGSPGIFEAKVDGKLIAKSKQPFLDSARKLAKLGYGLESTLAIYRKGSDVLALKLKLGAAAKLTVDEKGPFFKKFEPFSEEKKAKAQARKQPRPAP
jgi:hypothetical protein